MEKGRTTGQQPLGLMPSGGGQCYQLLLRGWWSDLPDHLWTQADGGSASCVWGEGGGLPDSSPSMMPPWAELLGCDHAPERVTPEGEAADTLTPGG